jgi:hypothetical protein
MSARHGAARRREAKNEVLAGDDWCRVRQAYGRPGGVARGQLFSIRERKVGALLGGSDMQSNFHTVRQGKRCSRHDGKMRVESPHRHD